MEYRDEAPDPPLRPHHGARRALFAHRRPRGGDGRRRGGGGGPPGGRRRRVADGPSGARLRRSPAWRHRGDEEAHPQLRKAPAHLDAPARGRASDRRLRPRPGRRGDGDRRAARKHLESRAVKFEKWQALGNDYLIVERGELPFELTPERIRAICAPHTGVGSDGILLLAQTFKEGFVAELRIYNPDGSEAELSGNGVREAVMYLRRRGWTDQDQFSIKTPPGEVRPQITDDTTCTVDMGRAKLRSEADFPNGGEDGTGTLT